MEKKKGFQTIVNKKALFDYQVLETLVAGIELTGAEVKSLRLGQASLKEGFVALTQRGLDLLNVTITPYAFARPENQDPKRTRRLLVHRHELERLRGIIAQKGITLIPLKLFLAHGRIKLEVGIGRGKKQFEKRETLKRRDMDREMARSLKDYRGR